MEKAVTFTNRQNKKLFGILHIPDNNRHRTGVNLLSPGLKNRVAPNRINVVIARRLCRQGYYVFRFDPAGIGDSEGDISGINESKMDLWGAVQRGQFVSDTLASNDFFLKEAEIDRLVIMGACGGAATAMLACARDRRIDALVAMDMPVRVVSSQLSVFDVLNESHKTDDIIAMYCKKIFNRQSWINLLTFKSDLSVIPKLLSRKLNETQKQEDAPSERFNTALLEAFNAFAAAGKRMYFIYAEKDRTTREFQQDFQARFIENNRAVTQLVRTHLVKNANHIYTEKDWQDELLDMIDQYMDNYIQTGR